MNDIPGPIVMLGSGETSLAGGRLFEMLVNRLPKPVRIALLETPAGFELNCSQVTGKVADFLSNRLQNFDTSLTSVPARKKGTEDSPDNVEKLEGLLDANLIFMGPGSPTYAVRQLKDSLAWDLVRARHRQGAALVFASAAMIAVGEYALPVYEIYKVGEDVQVVPGLNFFEDFGLSLSFIPHWNNADGGENIDTSRCFIGQDRFSLWCDELPGDHTTLGMDEHTGLVVDFNDGTCTVIGVSSATLLRDCDPRIYPSKAVFSIDELGELEIKEDSIINRKVWDMIEQRGDKRTETPTPDDDVVRLLEERELARRNQNWNLSDKLREQILLMGWVVTDTPEGPVLSQSSH